MEGVGKPGEEVERDEIGNGEGEEKWEDRKLPER